MSEPAMRTDYLGDGVYAEFDGFQVWIWTSDGIRSSEKIALEPETIDALNRFGARCRREQDIDATLRRF